jgi:hypothetical protein
MAVGQAIDFANSFPKGVLPWFAIYRKTQVGLVKLAISVWLAAKHAINQLNRDELARRSLPATREANLTCLTRLVEANQQYGPSRFIVGE